MPLLMHIMNIKKNKAYEAAYRKAASEENDAHKVKVTFKSNM